MKYQIVPVEPTKRLIIDLKDIMEPWGLSKEQVVACYKEFIRCAAGIGNCLNSTSPPAPSVEEIRQTLALLTNALAETEPHVPWNIDAIHNAGTELLAQFEAMEKEGSHD